jgi:hypothetical protein
MNFCTYNTGVLCDPAGRQCETCGWSPKEAERRRAGMAPTPKPVSQNRPKRVAKVDASGQVVEVYSSLSMAAKQNDTSHPTIRAMCEGATTRVGRTLGYTFRYID